MKQNYFHVNIHKLIHTTKVNLIFSLKIFLATSLSLIEIKKKDSWKGLKAHSKKSVQKTYLYARWSNLWHLLDMLGKGLIQFQDYPIFEPFLIKYPRK